MVVYDIRTDSTHASFIERVNRDLNCEWGKSYLDRFGPVCSPQWWACFDRGEFRVRERWGLVTHVGPQTDVFGEIEDVIEVDCADSIEVIERDEVWAIHSIRIGDVIGYTETEVLLHTPTGTTHFQITLRAEWSSGIVDADNRLA